MGPAVVTADEVRSYLPEDATVPDSEIEAFIRANPGMTARGVALRIAAWMEGPKGP